MAGEASLVGKSYEPFEYEVGREKIREYAHVVGETNPVHFDAHAAHEAGFRAVVAPPMFAVVYSAGAVAPAMLDPAVGMNFAMIVHVGARLRRRHDHHDRVGPGHLRPRDHDVLRLRVGVGQSGRARGSSRQLDQHRARRVS